MFYDDHMPLPFLFNPFKHHLGFIKDYIIRNQTTTKLTDKPAIIKDLKHMGVSLMDIYTGTKSLEVVFEEIMKFLISHNLAEKDIFGEWSGRNHSDFKTIEISDGSEWVLKYYHNEMRYVHPFPARFSQHSIRVKANTLKSAILYLIFKDKDFVTAEDLNSARAVTGLSPVKQMFDVEAIMQMIEILRA
jgi:hypothetical protein